MNWEEFFLAAIFLAAIIGFLKPKKSTRTVPVEKTSGTKSLETGDSKSHGWQTQFDRLATDAQSIQIIIGLDFGTAYTKVIVSGAGQKYGVPLRKNENRIDKYLLPTCIYENSNGEFSLEKSTVYCTGYSGLKMNILDQTLNHAAQQHIVIYIAQVLQKTREWVLNEKRDVFGGSRLEWEVNIGLPTEKYLDKYLKTTYQRLVDEAWYKSTDKQLRGDDGRHGEDRKLDPSLINGFPEFVAQIQTYIQSTQLQKGIHALVDVGAATIDATAFIVHDEQDRHPILAESVEKLGVNFLNQHRENGNVDEDFKEKSQKQLNTVLHNAYTGAPKNSEWDEKIPLMLCGGGARKTFYKEFYPEFIRKVSHTHHGKSLEKCPLPALDQLEIPDLAPEDHDRLSVAYGLSFDLSEQKITKPGLYPPDQNSSKPRFVQCPACSGHGGYNGSCPKCDGKGFL